MKPNALLMYCLCRRGSSKGAPYIKISEVEIADDYPEPAAYDKAGAPLES